MTRESFPDLSPPAPIEVDSELGLLIGLTSQIFVPTDKVSDSHPFGTQLFRSRDCMYVELIEIWAPKRGEGHLNRLFDRLWDLGFTIKVPNPTNEMMGILKAKDFERLDEPHPITSDIDVVMVKAPIKRQSEKIELILTTDAELERYS